MNMMKGMLAERLQRKKLAEKAYRKSVDIGSSYFVWWRLLKYYEASDQPKAILVCLAEILDRAEDDGINIWEGYPDEKGKSTSMPGRYPAWIEQSLAQLVSKIGLRATQAYAKEVDVLDQKILMRMLNTRIRQLNKSEGTDK